MMGQDYSSPVLADGKIYFFSRSGVGYVYAAGAEFKLLAQNHFAPGSGDFSSYARRERRPVVRSLQQVPVLRRTAGPGRLMVEKLLNQLGSVSQKINGTAINEPPAIIPDATG